MTLNLYLVKLANNFSGRKPSNMKTLKILVLLLMLLTITASFAQIQEYEGIPLITREDIARGLVSSDFEPSDSLTVVETEQYVLKKGDIISISVMEHLEFTKQSIRVLPDGGIEYPLLGNIKAEGMTVSVLRKIIEKRLLPYVTIPVVTIYVEKIYGHKVNVIGYVNSPGEYQIYEPLKITDALALARGIKNIRDVKEIRLIRKNGEIFDVEVRDLWFSNSLEISGDQLLIFEGDTIVVPPPREFPWHIYTAILATLSLAINVYSVSK